VFERRFHVGWSQLDANAHMANTGYLDLAANVRMAYFASAGTRRLTPPPPALAKTLLALGRAGDFEVLPARGWPS
jgi:acyl-CoA thioesterase FadM